MPLNPEGRRGDHGLQLTLVRHGHAESPAAGDADFDRVLGFGLADAPAAGADDGAPVDERVAALLAERQRARSARDFATADRIRDELAADGWEIVDTPDGPTVRPR